jgi:predicted metal-dependent phosphoesterase TrpH
MSLRYDLHSHSNASDGTLTPSELVARARQLEVDVLALTDHDTVAGIDEALEAARKLGVTLIPGVEISTTWQGQVVHIVGLGIDHRCPELTEGLDRLLEVRANRAREMDRRLERKGISGSYEGARAHSGGQLVGRAHFARFLVSSGHAPDMRRAFQHYLKRGKPGYVPCEWASLEESLAWIQAAGGQAVVAHPARHPFSNAKLRRLLELFLELGGAGLEVISGSHTRDDAMNMARHARELGLLGSSGSDYHGPDNPWVELGKLHPLPEGVTPIWHDWPEKQTALIA